MLINGTKANSAAKNFPVSDIINTMDLLTRKAPHKLDQYVQHMCTRTGIFLRDNCGEHL